MLSFAYFAEALPNGPFEVAGAYLVGVDGVPVRGEIRVEDGSITCQTRTSDPIGLAALWPVEGVGCVQLDTTRLLQRDEPYNLHLEFVRSRLLRISAKCEEWGLFDYPGMEDTAALVDQARDRFVAALQAQDDPAEVARIAQEALAIACRASDLMTRFHAAVFLGRRRSAGGFSRGFLGAALPADLKGFEIRAGATEVFDFVRVPFVWRDIHPKEKEISYDLTDRIVKSCSKAGLTLRGGPLLNFGVRFVPDWLYIWENDYEAIAEFAREHIQRTVQRYAGRVSTWVVASGLHADGVFPFTLEQIMDLTRMAATVTKQTDPRAQVVLDIVQPWGEYYASNTATVPPLYYAEMAVQSGIPFDALGLQFLFGIDSDGFHLRDHLQISALIDRLANFGKPLQVTAVGAPTQRGPRGELADPWNEATQATWLTDFTRVALSKPYVDSVCAYGLTDAGAVGIPGGGVLRDDQKPTPTLQALHSLRTELREG